MTVTVDPARCIGCGMCAYTAPGVFRIEGTVSAVLPSPDESQAAKAAAAADGCPVNAIQVKR